jgi:membrane protease YdiL (CAAX protease family)
LILLMPTAAALVLLVLASRGLLSSTSLSAGPRRACGLGGLDLAVAFALFALGPAVMQQVVAVLGWRPAGGSPQPGQVAMQALLGQLLVQGPLVLYTLIRTSRQPRGLAALGVTRPPVVGGVIVTAFLAFVVSMVLVNACNVVVVLLGQVLGYPPPSTGHQLLPLFRQASPLALAGLLLSAVVLAPLLEELIFRGLVQTAVLEVVGPARRWSAIALASLLFTSMHLSMPWQVLPGLFTLSCILGWLYERSGSLWPSIALHAAFNAANVAIVMLIPP